MSGTVDEVGDDLAARIVEDFLQQLIVQYRGYKRGQVLVEDSETMRSNEAV